VKLTATEALTKTASRLLQSRRSCGLSPASCGWRCACVVWGCPPKKLHWCQGCARGSLGEGEEMT